MKLVSFDLEIAKEIDDGADWINQRPLGISCAATAVRRHNGTIEYERWYDPSPNNHEGMPRYAARRLVNALLGWSIAGYTIVTVNGAGFDFDVLAEESGMLEECAQLTMDHVDLCFIVVALKGHYLGLDAMAKGARVEGKKHDVRLNDGSILHDMSGARAPKMWRRGERSAVLAYLQDDVRATLEAAEVIDQSRYIRWTSKKGRFNTISVPRLYTVAECRQLPKPNTSWMTNPPQRHQILAWTKPQ